MEVAFLAETRGRRIEVAAHAGFCMGVRRAVDTAEGYARAGSGNTCTLGDLIHNPSVVASLRERGIPPVHSVAEAAGQRVLIRSHGVTRQVMQELQEAGCDVVDLTCPFVAKLHQLAENASARGLPVILIGEQAHPEVIGTAGWVDGDCYVIASAEEAERLPPLEAAAVVSQTTFPPSRWDSIVQVLRSRIPQLEEHCTICSATAIRQQEAEELAGRAEAMIVIGGRNSANTRKLYETCRARCAHTILVESAAEIPPAFANSFQFFGVTAGASTPDSALKEVVITMSDIENTAPETQETTHAVESESDFGAMLEAQQTRQPRLRVNAVVSGEVLQVGDDEVVVSIGGKSDGVLKRADMADKEVQVGDKIEVKVIKMNDGEGNVVLSQRGLISEKKWKALMEQYEAGNCIIEGRGKEAVKGGLLMDYDGIRVFIPASHLDSHYVEKIEDFVGKEIRAKIIEVDKEKKRIVASRKECMKEEREAARKAAWDRLEEGMVIHGVVRRIREFGAFVDVGGVDGLVHITDLSWGRIKDPSEVVKPGQEIDVKVLKLNPENGRIQLGYKQLQTPPWETAAERYPVDAIVEGKVVRITTFGAFVELEPGLDGLVHLTQCALTKVNKVEDAVKVGDIVRVKILNVDTEHQRISLSIKAALEDEAMESAEGELDIPAEEEAAPEAVEAAPEAEAPAEE